jgi:hypothetical protein
MPYANVMPEGLRELILLLVRNDDEVIISQTQPPGRSRSPCHSGAFFDGVRGGET